LAGQPRDIRLRHQEDEASPRRSHGCLGLLDDPQRRLRPARVGERSRQVGSHLIALGLGHRGIGQTARQPLDRFSVLTVEIRILAPHPRELKLPAAKPQVAGAPHRAGLEPVQPIGSTEQLEAAAEARHRHEPKIGVALRLSSFDRALQDRQARVRARVPAQRNSQRALRPRELGTGGLGDLPGCLRLLEDVASSEVEVVA